MKELFYKAALCPAGGRLYKSPAKQAYLKSKALSVRVWNLFNIDQSFVCLVNLLTFESLFAPFTLIHCHSNSSRTLFWSFSHVEIWPDESLSERLFKKADVCTKREINEKDWDIFAWRPRLALCFRVTQGIPQITQRQMSAEKPVKLGKSSARLFENFIFC